jgi:methionyl-tRNA formyltransferase
MKIIFMGSPNFAIPSLQKLLTTKHHIAAVYSKPPAKSGRGLKEQPSVVASLAMQNQLTVITPTTLNDDQIFAEFKDFAPDIAIVVAYGKIIPEKYLSIPKYGFINIHPSDLPRWRGAAPIERTIMAGDKTTAICIMKLVKELDAGDIIMKEKINLHDKITTKELHDQAAEIGSDLLIRTLDSLSAEGEIKSHPQSTNGLTYAEKIISSERKINFSDNVQDVYNLIRTFSPHPGAYFTHNNQHIKIITAEYTEEKHGFKCGQIIDNQLTIACKDGFIKPSLLQRAGKKMIYTDAFLRGYEIKANCLLL